jgi:hypothetical protein
MAKELNLTHDKTSLVDDIDYERCKKHNWHFRNVDGYAATSVTIPGEKYVYRDGSGRKKSKQKTVLLHHFILGINGREDLCGKVVDHLNSDRLDNRKENLRIISVTRNLHNRKGLNKNNTLGYPNIQLCKKSGKYRYRIRFNNIHYYSKYEFLTAKDCYESFLKFKVEKGM